MAEFASTIKDSLHLTALVESAEAVLDGIDLSPLLMYLIDTTSAEALPYLAEQFNVLGFKGWALAETEEQQRALLKKALELQRYKGTPWAIKEILKAVGFGGAEIEEGGTGFSPLHDGVFLRNGLITYGGATAYDWATFNIAFDLGETRGVTDAETALAVKVVEEYKNARSRLLGISFKVNISDALPIGDDALVYNKGAEPITESTRNGIIRNGTALYNGVNTHGGTSSESAFIVVRNSSGTIIQIDTF